MDFVLVLSSLPDGRVFNVDSQTVIQIVANFINVGGLAVILSILLYRPVRNILRKRTDRIQGQLIQAEEEMKHATELRLEYEKKIQQVEQEREDILSEARRAASDTGRRLIAEAKKEADTIRERAAHNVEMEWERAESDMRTAIIDVSAVMAEKFVSLAINKETHDRLFDETMAELEGTAWKH